MNWGIKVKKSNKNLISTRELIEIQSSVYYRRHFDLGFDTIANTYPEYAQAIGQLLARLWTEFNKKNKSRDGKKVHIIELGPGTGAFARTLASTLDTLNISYQYHLVDVNSRMADVASEMEATFHQTTFDHFARTWKGTVDFLIANQALDMWAGDNVILDENVNRARLIKWKLFNCEKNKYLGKKDVINALSGELETNSLFWIKHVESGVNSWRKITPNFGKSIFDEYIKLPRMLTVLLKKVRLGGVFQDYWSFETPNPLSAGMTRSTCQLVQNAFPRDPWIPLYQHYASILTQEEQFRDKINLMIHGDQHKKDSLESIAWMPTPIIPFGQVDVTYAPNIQELLDKLEKLKFSRTVLTVNELVANEVDSKIEMSPTDWKSERFVVLFEKEWLHAMSFQ